MCYLHTGRPIHSNVFYFGGTKWQLKELVCGFFGLLLYHATGLRGLRPQLNVNWVHAH